MTTSARAQRIKQLTADTARIERQISALKKGDVGLELDSAACQLMQENPTAFKDYASAVEHVLQHDEDIRDRYVASFGTHKLSPSEQAKATQHAADDDDDDAETEESAGKKLDAIAQAWLREHPGESYERALGIAREQKPELWKKYARRRS